MTNPQNWAEVEKEFGSLFINNEGYSSGDMHYHKIKSFLHDKLLEAEKVGAERAVDYIQEAKLPIFSAKTSLFDGNKVLSQVSEDMVVKVQDLMEVLKAARESKETSKMEWSLPAENIGMLRQWLNEDRITDPKKLITNEDILYFLTLAAREGKV